MTECFNNVLIITVLHLGAVNKRLISFGNCPILSQLQASRISEDCAYCIVLLN